MKTKPFEMNTRYLRRQIKKIDQRCKSNDSALRHRPDGAMAKARSKAETL